MNELESIVLNHEYRGNIGRHKFIYKRTKRKRIKDKVFTKLFTVYTLENPLTVFDDIVLMEYDMYVDLLATLENLRLEIERKQEEVDNYNESYGIC